MVVMMWGRRGCGNNNDCLFDLERKRGYKNGVVEMHQLAEGKGKITTNEEKKNADRQLIIVGQSQPVVGDRRV